MDILVNSIKYSIDFQQGYQDNSMAKEQHPQQMTLEQLDIHMQRNKVEPPLLCI